MFIDTAKYLAFDFASIVSIKVDFISFLRSFYFKVDSILRSFLTLYLMKLSM